VNVFGLALRNIKGSAFRSTVVFVSILGLAGFFLATTLITGGAQNSLGKGLERLGADIIVVPVGSEARVESALLMGRPVSVWMPAQNSATISALSGVAAASPQIYISSLSGASCCAVSEMFIVVYEPKTDFTVSPWIETIRLRGDIGKGDGIGGTYVFTPPGEKWLKLYGYNITLKGNLAATGTGLDATLFITDETAREMARASITQAEKPLVIPPDSVSSVLVRVSPGADLSDVARRIAQSVPGVVAIESPQLFGSLRAQLSGLTSSFMTILGISWALAVLFIGLVFSLAAGEQRRQIGVLRALGATRWLVFKLVLSEAVILSLSAGVLGIVLSSAGIFVFRDLISNSMHIPFLFPSFVPFLVLVGESIGLALLTVTVAAIVPAYRTSRQDAAAAMRE